MATYNLQVHKGARVEHTAVAWVLILLCHSTSAELLELGLNHILVFRTPLSPEKAWWQWLHLSSHHSAARSSHPMSTETYGDI